MSYYRKLVSFSDLDLFDTCERKYYFEKICAEPQRPSAILEVGSTYHSALANMWRDMTKIPEIVDAVIREHSEALKPFGVDQASLREEMIQNLERIRYQVVAVIGVSPLEGTIERRFENHKIGFKGVTDVVLDRTPFVNPQGKVIGSDDGPCVIDWKSLTSDRRRSQRDCDLSPQLALYAIQNNVAAAGFVEIPRNLEKDVRVRIVRYTEDDKKEWLSYLTQQRASILSRGKRKDAYRQTNRKNPLCSALWCQHFCKCYLTPHLPGATIAT